MASTVTAAGTYTIARGLANTAHTAVVSFMPLSSNGVAYGYCYADVTAFGTNGAFTTWTPPGPYVLCVTDSLGALADAWPFHVRDITPVVVACGGILCSAQGAANAPHIPPMDVWFPYKIMPNYSNGVVGPGAIAQTDQQCSAALIELGTNDAGMSISTSAFKSGMQTLIGQVRSAQGNIPVAMMRGLHKAGASQDFSVYGGVEAQIASSIYPSSSALTPGNGIANTVLIDTDELNASMTYQDRWAHPDKAGLKLLAGLAHDALAGPPSLTSVTSGR